MARAYIAPRRKMMKSRKYNGKCEHCGTPKPLSEVYCYIDDVNPAITYNAPICVLIATRRNITKNKPTIKSPTFCGVFLDFMGILWYN